MITGKKVASWWHNTSDGIASVETQISGVDNTINKTTSTVKGAAGLLSGLKNMFAKPSSNDRTADPSSGIKHPTGLLILAFILWLIFGRNKGGKK